MKSDRDEPIFLRDEVEASLLEALLTGEGIPFFIKRYQDPAFKGFPLYAGSWGHVDTPPSFRERVREILGELRQS